MLAEATLEVSGTFLGEAIRLLILLPRSKRHRKRGAITRIGHCGPSGWSFEQTRSSVSSMAARRPADSRHCVL